jgi:Pyruvate/2-oxoacid:ferredoxin oxidoreductase delta subunit
MGAIEIIRRRLKEDMVPDVPDEIGEKKKRPREVAFMDINLCFPCGKCPEFCPVQCIEYLRPGSVPGRGVQPVQDRYQECIGCYICVEVCALLTDYDAVRMYDVDLVEKLLGETIGPTKPADYQPAEAVGDYFSEGGAESVRAIGKGLPHPREVERRRAGGHGSRARLTGDLPPPHPLAAGGRIGGRSGRTRRRWTASTPSSRPCA